MTASESFQTFCSFCCHVLSHRESQKFSFISKSRDVSEVGGGSFHVHHVVQNLKRNINGRENMIFANVVKKVRQKPYNFRDSLSISHGI